MDFHKITSTKNVPDIWNILANRRKRKGKWNHHNLNKKKKEEKRKAMERNQCSRFSLDWFFFRIYISMSTWMWLIPNVNWFPKLKRKLTRGGKKNSHSIFTYLFIFQSKSNTFFSMETAFVLRFKEDSQINNHVIKTLECGNWFSIMMLVKLKLPIILWAHAFSSMFYSIFLRMLLETLIDTNALRVIKSKLNFVVTFFSLCSFATWRRCV